jgi:tripartite-type tricarboxylate transporter receptor subunit TctC
MKRLLASLLLTFAAGAALAQPYPGRPVRIVASFPPGTGVDIAARIVAHKLAEALGQQFVVDNRAGAGGNIAAELVVKSPHDGYTLLFTNNAYTINPNLQRSVPYDPLKDFAPVSLAGLTAQVLVAHPSLPANTTQEVIALARSRPGRINAATAGSGSPSHLALATFRHLAAVDIVHVPYKGAPPALTDLIAGQVDLYFSGLPPALAMTKAGKVKAIAVSTSSRSSAMPDVPTFAESGLAGYDVPLWYGLFAPAGVPAPIVSRLVAEVAKGLASPDGKERFIAQGVEPRSSTPAEFSALIRAELQRWAALVKIADIKVE